MPQHLLAVAAKQCVQESVASIVVRISIGSGISPAGRVAEPPDDLAHINVEFRHGRLGTTCWQEPGRNCDAITGGHGFPGE